MNTVVTILSIILFIIVVIFYLRNRKLTFRIKSNKALYLATKEENIQLALILVNLTNLVNTSISPMNINYIPFKVIDLDKTEGEGTKETIELTSIRFKQVEDMVLIYLNGAMKPYDGNILLNYNNTLTDNDFINVRNLRSLLQSKQLTGVNIIESLKQINAQFKN